MVAFVEFGCVVVYHCPFNIPEPEIFIQLKTDRRMSGVQGSRLTEFQEMSEADHSLNGREIAASRIPLMRDSAPRNNQIEFSREIKP
jgi:hypothetical protein